MSELPESLAGRRHVPSGAFTRVNAPQLPFEIETELRQTAHFGKAETVLREAERAVSAYEEEDYEAALHHATIAKRMAPRSSSVRELLGLAHYRLGHFKDATRELMTYRRLSERRDEDHVIADCERALGRPEKALAILDGIKMRDVGEELLVECFVVATGALLDLERPQEAVDLLMTGPLKTREVHEYHLRLWYALADALEKAGRRSEARPWWDRVYNEDPEFFDVARRRLRREI